MENLFLEKFSDLNLKVDENFYQDEIFLFKGKKILLSFDLGWNSLVVYFSNFEVLKFLKNYSSVNRYFMSDMLKKHFNVKVINDFLNFKNGKNIEFHFKKQN